MLRGGERRAVAGRVVEERRRRSASHRADAFDRPVAIDSLSRPDQAAVQPAGIPLPARDSRQVGEYLKSGEAELGIAAELGSDWDRLDVWPLFTEGFELVVNSQHALAKRDGVEFGDLRSEQLLSRRYCEHAGRINDTLREHGLDVEGKHEIASERDLIELLEADIGVAVVPRTAATPPTLARKTLDGLDARRTVHLYGVAGRERTAVASAVMRMLRGTDWQQFLSRSPAT